MELIKSQPIENKIYTIRGIQIMLDSDLAEIYQIETKVLNQAVKRNNDRFPNTFRFQLTDDEFNDIRSQFVTLESKGNSLRSQSATLKDQRGKHRKYLPYVFTEQGVAMLSAVLRSDVAVQVSIQIIQAFVKMRSFLLQNAAVFQRLDNLEINQLKTNEKIEQIFKALDAGQPEPDKGVFFDGQVFDAYAFVCDLVKKAKKGIILIDNFVDESVLTLLNKRNPKVQTIIYTKEISKSLKLDLQKHNAQYPPIEIKTFTKSHDRFLIIDQNELYHIGASLKDLGKKWFAFSRMDSLTTQVLNNLKEDEA
ncbi:MAG: ORF6N domain-containing protein [Bacteroidales bacterium]|nr:ORF6N domain-containing protein [Bacteroidales bacterium]